MSDTENTGGSPPAAEAGPKEEKGTHINVKVSDGTQEVFFKVKRNTKFRRLMEAFAKRQGTSPDTMRFVVDGGRVHADQTPEDLDMDDGDTIEAHRAQIGGCL